MSTPTNDTYVGKGDIAGGLFETIVVVPDTQDRVQVGNGATNWLAADLYLGDGSGHPGTAGTWAVKPGGDWIDASGTFNGSNHYYSQLVSGTTLTLDISGIDGDLLLSGITGWSSATIDGGAATGFWMDSSSAGSLQPPTSFDDPSIILNPNRGKTLVLTRTTSNTQTLTIDKVAGPTIPDYPYGTVSNTPNVGALDLSSDASILGQIGSANMAGGGNDSWAYNREYLTDSATGLKYFRFTGGPTTGPRLISWFWVFGQSLTHAFCRYALWIEDDVADGMTELGMKLPGFVSGLGENFSLRTEHGPVSPVAGNRGIYKGVRYVYDQGHSGGTILSIGRVAVRANRWIIVEQELKLNDVGVSNGVYRVKINGNLAFESLTENTRGTHADWFIDAMHINVYHGGTGSPSKTIHYRIAAVAVSTSEIGMPPELVGNQWPAWRRNLPLNTFTAIPNSQGTIPAGQSISNEGDSQVDLYTAYAVGDTAVYALPGSGHWGNGSFRNETYKIDMNVDNPAWALDCAGSTTHADRSTFPRYEPDGKPVACQTYHSSWWVAGQFCPDGKERCFQMTKPVCAVPTSQNPYTVYTVDGYRTADKAWDAGGPAPGGPTVGGTWNDYPFPPGSYADFAMGRDPRTGWIYISNTNVGAGTYLSVFKPNVGSGGTHTALWHNFSGTVTGVPGSFTGWQFVSFAVDTKRNRLVTVSQIGSSNSTVYWLNWIDLATFKFGFLQIPVGALSYGGGNGNAFCYDPDNDQYLFCYSDSSTVYRVDPDTANTTVFQVLPYHANHGIDNRMDYMAGMGGVFFHSTGFDPVMFMPTRVNR